MQPLIELILLAAAVDGNIDDDECVTILKSLAQNSMIMPISEAQISSVKLHLLERLQSGHSPEGVIKIASLSLNKKSKILSYAIAVEVVLSNGELTKSEIQYLKLHRSILELDPDEVESIHFSAHLRYGFGEFK